MTPQALHTVSPAHSLSNVSPAHSSGPQRASTLLTLPLLPVPSYLSSPFRAQLSSLALTSDPCAPEERVEDTGWGAHSIKVKSPGVGSHMNSGHPGHMVTLELRLSFTLLATEVITATLLPRVLHRADVK